MMENRNSYCAEYVSACRLLVLIKITPLPSSPVGLNSQLTIVFHPDDADNDAQNMTTVVINRHVGFLLERHPHSINHYLYTLVYGISTYGETQ